MNYWGRVPGVLQQRGARLFYGRQDSHGSIEGNAEQIKAQVLKALEETGAAKVNLLAHSKGGLDARYLITRLGMGDRVASLTTFSTPHHGSKTVDKLLSLPNFLVRTACFCCDLWARAMGDKKPDSHTLFHQLTTTHARDFNHSVPDDDGVYYQSYAFVMHSARSDCFMTLPYLFVKRVEGESDGLVTPASAQWGAFRGVVHSASKRGISHCDEVDMRRTRLSKTEKEGRVSDIPTFYAGVVSELRQRGF